MKIHHAITVALLCFIAVLSWNANEQRSLDTMVRQAHAFNLTSTACPAQQPCPAGLLAQQQQPCPAGPAGLEQQQPCPVCQACPEQQPCQATGGCDKLGKYDLSHLDQPPAQEVSGPMQVCGCVSQRPALASVCSCSMPLIQALKHFAVPHLWPQDDEALFVYGIVRAMRMSSVLEIGGQTGYSANNFLQAMTVTNGIVYTVDVNPVKLRHATRHKFIQKDAKYLTPQDVDNKPLDLVLFDCHVLDVQMEMCASAC